MNEPLRDKEPPFTDWEIAALGWLPADGSWRDGLTQKQGGTVESLFRYHQMAEYERVGGVVWRARLSERGKRAKAQLPKLKAAVEKLQIEILTGG
jgi:hypothetical protein